MNYVGVTTFTKSSEEASVFIHRPAIGLITMHAFNYDR